MIVFSTHKEARGSRCGKKNYFLSNEEKKNTIKRK
jgi:hypothetical protein